MTGHSTLPFLALSVAISTPAIQAQSSAGVAEPSSVAEITLSNEFDRWVGDIMEEWDIPGLAVGAIENGEVVLLKGFGHRDVEAKAPVTPRTLMAIGSNSKSFTVILMAQLVNEGKLDWEKPVTHYLPDFRLWDDYATEKFRVKDLVTHVSGLPRHDAVWYGRSYNREEIYQRLRHLEPTTSFRGRWQYQNLMFLTAGYLVEQITGQSWDDLIRDRIFMPLSMHRSNTSTDDMPSADDFAYPYVLVDEELQRVPFRNIDNVGPAGSINSSIEEMLHYIGARIRMGEGDGVHLASGESEQLMQSAQSIVGSPDRYPELGPATYGLALWISSYRGRKWVQHGGGIDGFISQMAWLPNDSIGVMVLTNRSGTNPVPNIVVRRVFDDLLGLEPIDWNARMRSEAEEGRAREAEEEKKRADERIADTSPSHPLADYAGTYEHPAYGTIEVRSGADGLEMTFDKFTAKLEHYHYDVFELVDDGSPLGRLSRGILNGLVMFHMDKQGTIEQLGVPLEPSVGDIAFERVEK